MDAESSVSLERTVSVHSVASVKSVKSYRSSASRPRKRLTSQLSSSASSATSDKSLTSFPSFSPEPPRDERPTTPNLYDDATLASANIAPPPPSSPSPALLHARQNTTSSAPATESSTQARPASIVGSLLSTPPQLEDARNALFDDSPPAPASDVPGALHRADDEHIERLVARDGAVGLVRRLAEDLARRDAQIAGLRRRADERERALRRIVRECGLSNLDLETRLRAIEQEERAKQRARMSTGDRLENMMSDAMGHDALMAMRRAPAGRSTAINVPARSQPQDRWDILETTPTTAMKAQENFGPVEMDTILPPEVQPPTLTCAYNNNNYGSSEYLTDRFGFIYDQRRKKRQREAAQLARKMGRRHEGLTNGRSGLSPVGLDDDAHASKDLDNNGRPDSPSATDENRDDARPKRWQDYLKVATFPTELLSHTPSISVPGFEVMEGGEVTRSLGLTTSEERRGFIPSSATTTAAIDSESQPATELEQASGTSFKEEAEPVRLLLHQLSEVHDSLQREKTARWNDFLRKVRAERKREGQAAAAAAEVRFQKAFAVTPETRIGDGELIGVASLGVQGKAGRAKAIEFKQLVLGGIPVAYRAKIWSECSGARALRVPSYYEDLVDRRQEQDDMQVVAQITADITRTLTDNIFFRKGPGVAKLNEVLLAYARRNPEVGYCQGMNLVAANLLLIMPSTEEAFWVLTSIVERILPQGYFDHSLLASRADQQVLRLYVAEVLPRLSAHFDELAIDLETMTFQWFLSVFTDCLSAEALFRVWDVVLCTADGGTFLFQVALALLKLNEPQLLNCGSPASVYTYINHQMTNHAISIDGLVQASEGLRRVVRRDEVEARRRRAIEDEKEQLRKREERNAARRALQVKALAAAQQPETVAEEVEPEPDGPALAADAISGAPVDDANGTAVVATATATAAAAAAADTLPKTDQEKMGCMRTMTHRGP
ncbi:hypothetical protein P8C59_006926 [Phyllachora maydis]|uniref:Rab-GAP TBC domain-containing protein n=1 Tax=Phyllachora maydis TaxID=1825666 RepID=A0AAD9I8I7_9PEZI|nr:hypothetical protein P8C59_006926 [Phyllachora maydis]